MSVAIRKSLNKLNSAVEKLEVAVATKKAVSVQMKKGGQPVGAPDLFTAAQPPSNMSQANVKMLATRLDAAILQVEEILKEGRG